MQVTKSDKPIKIDFFMDKSFVLFILELGGEAAQVR
jgi:hypothetical protein